MMRILLPGLLALGLSVPGLGAPAASPLPDLPLVAVPASGSSPATADQFALVISGDGGWSALDRRLAEAFGRRGIPVVGLDSLRYFWRERTPQEAARDVAAMIDRYAALWNRHRVHLIGYSFGADVMPFVVNRLPPEISRRVASITLLSPSDSAIFEVHISNWLPGVVTPGTPLQPEIARMGRVPLCLFGAGEPATFCDQIAPGQSHEVGKGHRLGGDGEAVVTRILQNPAGSAAAAREAACAARDPCG